MRLWPFGSAEEKKPSTPSDANVSDPTGAMIIPKWQEGKPLWRGQDYEAMLSANTKWVYRCVQVIADSASSAPFRIYTMKTASNNVRLFNHRKVGKKKVDHLVGTKSHIARAVTKAGGNDELVEIVDHPFIDLLEAVNPFMNGTDLNKLKWTYERLTGNAYWYKVRNGMGVPVRLWPLHTPNVSIIPSAENFISGYEYRQGSTKTILPEEDVVHFKDPSPHDLFYGMSPLAGAVDSVTLQKYMDKFDIDLFNNKAVPQVVLTTDKEINSSIAERVRQGWRDKFGFMQGRTGDIAILDANLRPHQLTMNPSDLNYVEGQDRVLKEILGVYGVPITKVDPSQIVANTEAAEIQFMRDTVTPLLKRDEQKINEKLLPDFDERLFGAYDDVVPDDREFKAKMEDQDQRNGIRTRNEIRMSRGMKPLPPDIGDVVPSVDGQQATPQGDEMKAIVDTIAKGVVNRVYGS